MENRKRGQPTGQAAPMSGGSAGTPGKAGRDQDENARVADTTPGDIRSGAEATAGRLGGPGMQYTAAERGSGKLERIPGMEGQVRRREAGTGTAGMGGQSEEAGMWQTSRMIAEAREEGDPDLRAREEDLHARQQNLAERDQSLREREEQLRTREQGLRERQSRGVTGRGMGATDYTDDIHIQNRR